MDLLFKLGFGLECNRTRLKIKIKQFGWQWKRKYCTNNVSITNHWEFERKVITQASCNGDQENKLTSRFEALTLNVVRLFY